MKYSAVLNFYNLLPLYIPDPKQVKVTYETLLTKDPSTSFPYWAQVWPSAKAMTAFLEKNLHWVQHKQVLELGAGIGLPSFSIATYAQSILVTDHNPEAVLYLEKNIQNTGYVNMKSMCLDWNFLPASIKADVVLLSDINYDPNTFPVLLQVIQKFIEQGATIILTTPQRITVTPFAEALQPYTKQSTLIQIEHLQQWIDIRILILSQ